MAALTLPPTNNAAGQAATQPCLSEKPAKDAADPSGMESEWVLLGKSDIVPADVAAAAAAAAAGHRRLNFSPLPMIPIWWELVDRTGGWGQQFLNLAVYLFSHVRQSVTIFVFLALRVQMVLGGVVYTAVPFYKRARKTEGETLANVETAVEVVEHVAEVTEKLAANAADSLPENGSLHKVAVEIEYIAEVVDKDAHKVEAVIEKIEEVSDKMDATVEPVIDELEKDLKSNSKSSTGSDAQRCPSGCKYNQDAL